MYVWGPFSSQCLKCSGVLSPQSPARIGLYRRAVTSLYRIGWVVRCRISPQRIWWRPLLSPVATLKSPCILRWLEMKINSDFFLYFLWYYCSLSWLEWATSRLASRNLIVGILINFLAYYLDEELIFSSYCKERKKLGNRNKWKQSDWSGFFSGRCSSQNWDRWLANGSYIMHRSLLLCRLFCFVFLYIKYNLIPIRHKKINPGLHKISRKSWWTDL